MTPTISTEFCLHLHFVGDYSLAAFLYVSPHELLGVLLEDPVDLVQERVDVLGHFLGALGDVGVDRRLDLLGLLARPRGPLLPAGVPGGHLVLLSSVLGRYWR